MDPTADQLARLASEALADLTFGDLIAIEDRGDDATPVERAALELSKQRAATPLKAFKRTMIEYESERVRWRELPARRRRQLDGMTLRQARASRILCTVTRVARPAARRRGAGRPRAAGARRRVTSTRAGPDSDSDEPEPAAVRLAAPPKSIYQTWPLSRCPSCGRVLLWADGRLVCCSRSCPRWGRPA